MLFSCVARGLSPVFCSQDPLLLLLLFDFFSHALFRAAGYWYRRPTFIFIRISRDEIFNAFSQPHYFTLNKMLQEAIKPNEFKFLKKLYSVINDHTLKQKIRPDLPVSKECETAAHLQNDAAEQKVLSFSRVLLGVGFLCVVYLQRG